MIYQIKKNQIFRTGQKKFFFNNKVNGKSKNMYN